MTNRSNLEAQNIQSSQNALKELKKKWNQVSNRPKTNLNHSSINENHNSNYLNESLTNRNTSTNLGEFKTKNPKKNK